MALPKTPGRTTTGFAFAYVERALLEGIGRRQFGLGEQARVVEFFSVFDDVPRCSYCGSSDPRRWDHVVAVKNGGETVLGNMILACGACDDSKQHRPFDEWLRGKGFGDAEERIDRIRRYMAHHEYTPRAEHEILSEEKLAELRELRNAAAVLRQRMEAFLRSLSDTTAS